MNNEHTPGFYAIEEYRCKRIYNAICNHTSNNQPISDYCTNITFDRINAIQNRPVYKDISIDYAEEIAYKQKKKFFQKLIQRIK